MCKVEEEETKIIQKDFLPRRAPLVFGTTLISQGKSSNQRNGALYATGDIIQTLDANQDCCLAECLKIPFVLRMFEMDPYPKYRIVGFREHIFTRPLNVVASFHADQEWSFGTIYQRALGSLGVRLHYGHPDFFDSK